MATDPKPEFVGTAGPGSNLDINVPLPGLFVGKRMVMIDGVKKAQWHTRAYEYGTPAAEALGIEKQAGGYVLTNPERFTNTFVGQKTKLAPVDAKAVTALPSTLTRSAPHATRAESRVGSQERSTPTARTSSGGPELAATAATEPRPTTAPSAEEALATEVDANMLQLKDGIVKLPSATWSGSETTVDVDLAKSPAPALFIVQTVGISSFLGNYGLGKTVKTFSLLPGEETKIHTRTWKATKVSQQAGSSIIDSYNTTTADEFAETLYDESTDKVTKDRSSSYTMDLGASLNLGIVKANAGGSAELNFASGTEEFAKNTSEAVSKHAATASSNREASVTSSSESSVSTEDEEVTERTIKNINVKRVLNFVFRELNQEYIVKTHLKDVRIGFSNGNLDSWMEAPLSGLRSLLESVLANEAAVQEIGQIVLRMIAMTWDSTDTPIPTLERIALSADGKKLNMSPATRDSAGGYTVPPVDGSWTYRFKRGPLGQGGQEFVVDGVLLRQNTVVLKTDSLVVEALLGTADALDDYSVLLQNETIREKQLNNDAIEVDTRKIQLGVDLVKDKDSASVALYHTAFGPADSPPAE